MALVTFIEAGRADPRAPWSTRASTAPRRDGDRATSVHEISCGSPGSAAPRPTSTSPTRRRSSSPRSTTTWSTLFAEVGVSLVHLAFLGRCSLRACFPSVLRLLASSYEPCPATARRTELAVHERLLGTDSFTEPAARAGPAALGEALDDSGDPSLRPGSWSFSADGLAAVAAAPGHGLDRDRPGCARHLRHGWPHGEFQRGPVC